MSLHIQKSIGEPVMMSLSGRLDTTTASDLEASLADVLANAKALVLDLAGLEYISSAGLRVILKAQKTMCVRNGMKLVHVPEAVLEVFDITGFSDFLTIEK